MTTAWLQEGDLNRALSPVDQIKSNLLRRPKQGSQSYAPSITVDPKLCGDPWQKDPSPQIELLHMHATNCPHSLTSAVHRQPWVKVYLDNPSPQNLDPETINQVTRVPVLQVLIP